MRQAGGVVLLDGKVVLRRTAQGEFLFPKGHVEPGESPEAAAVREVAEETGVKAEAEQELGDIFFTYQGERFRVTFFLMHATGQLPTWRSHLERDTIAVPPGQVATLLSFENYRRLWTKARRLLPPPPEPS